jgi:hypothetical protein
MSTIMSTSMSTSMSIQDAANCPYIKQSVSNCPFIGKHVKSCPNLNSKFDNVCESDYDIASFYKKTLDCPYMSKALTNNKEGCPFLSEYVSQCPWFKRQQDADDNHNAGHDTYEKENDLKPIGLNVNKYGFLVPSGNL